MFKKVSLVLCAVASIAWVLIQFRNMHFYYIRRAEEYTAAQIYLKSDVCANGELNRQLGNFARCEDSKRILTMSPWASAWYDFLEDMYICGHGRCDVFWNEISGKLPYIILFTGGIMMWITYQSVQTQRIQNSMMMWQLPLMNPRLQMSNLQFRHEHGD
jgi:hypothetical protein